MTLSSPVPSRSERPRQARSSQCAGLAVLGNKDAVAELLRREVCPQVAPRRDPVVHRLKVAGNDRRRGRCLAHRAHLFSVHDNVAQPRHLSIAGIQDDDLRTVGGNIGRYIVVPDRITGKVERLFIRVTEDNAADLLQPVIGEL